MVMVLLFCLTREIIFYTMKVLQRIPILLSLFLASCIGTNPLVTLQGVRRHDVIAPDYRMYVLSDHTLNEAQRGIRLSAIMEWSKTMEQQREWLRSKGYPAVPETPRSVKEYLDAPETLR